MLYFAFVSFVFFNKTNFGKLNNLELELDILQRVNSLVLGEDKLNLHVNGELNNDEYSEYHIPDTTKDYVICYTQCSPQLISGYNVFKDCFLKCFETRLNEVLKEVEEDE